MLAEQYFSEIKRILDEVLKTQGEKIHKASEIIYKAIRENHSVFVFGCNHAGILAQELFYRSGGLAVINPIMAPGVSLDVFPVTFTTEMERQDGYGRVIINNSKLREGDVLIIHSVSGRNSVPIDAAFCAKEKGAYVLALTNLQTSAGTTSRHHSGKRLFEVADLVIDNCGAFGDAALEIQGFSQRFAPSSTAVGAAILNALVAEVIGKFVDNGETPPVFMSSNVDGGDEHNKKILEKYKDNIFYM